MAAILPESELRKRQIWVVAFMFIAAAIVYHRFTQPGADRPAAGRFDSAAEAFAYRRMVELRGQVRGCNPRDETVSLVMWAVAEARSGGLNQFYYNSAGDSAAETVEAFERIGAVETALIFRAAGDLFGSDGPPRDRLERRKRLALFDWDERARLERLDDAFHARGDDLFLLLQRYFEADRDEIPRDPLEAFLPWSVRSS